MVLKYKMGLVGLLLPLASFAFAGRQMKPIPHGLEVCEGKARLRVEFVTPVIVRVQYQPDGVLAGNGTDVCLPRKQKKLRLTYTEEYYLQ